MGKWTEDEIAIVAEHGPRLLPAELLKLLPQHTLSAIAHQKSRLGVKYVRDTFIPTTKPCRTCGVEKPLNDFHLNCQARDGHSSMCKQCACSAGRLAAKDPEVKARRNAYNEEYRNRPGKRERARERAKAYHGQPHIQEHFRDLGHKKTKQWKYDDLRGYKIYRMLQHAKERAKKQNVPFNITEEDFNSFRELDYCPVFPWIELSWDNPKLADDSPTIDKIVPKLGYVPGNVRILSWRANRIKLDSSIDEIVALAEDVLRRIEQQETV